MAKKQENMFGSFGAAVEQREQEQQQIEATVTGEVRPKARKGRPRKRQDATTITLVISKADKEKVQQWAFDHSVTVSDLLHRWIEENCTE